MKTLLTLAMGGMMTLSSMAVGFDADGFGAKLNGWKTSKRIASYSFVDGNYRTHYPTMTKTSSRGLFLSSRVDQGTGSTNILHIELTFSRSGQLMIGQVKGTFAGKKVDTGLITRAEEVAPIEGEKAVPVDPLNPTDRLAADLFAALDTALLKNAEGAEQKVDLIGRLFGSKNLSNISGAIRHNFNLMLAEVY